MVKPVLPILRLNFITKLRFINLSKLIIFLPKPITLTMYSYFCISALFIVASLSTTDDITPNFSESNYIFTPTTNGISYLV